MSKDEMRWHLPGRETTTVARIWLQPSRSHERVAIILGFWIATKTEDNDCRAKRAATVEVPAAGAASCHSTKVAVY